MPQTLFVIIAAVVSYAIGSLNIATMLAASRKKDVRTMGSGNPGTMNMMRNFGAKLGAVTLLLDIAKGALPVMAVSLVCRYTDISGGSEVFTGITQYTAGLCVILGHIYPAYYRFKGGKGIATTLGVFLVTNWLLALIAFAISVLYILLFEYGSVGNLIMITVMCCVEGYRVNHSGYELNTALFILCMLLMVICFMTWFAHRTNLYRLMVGKEHKTRLKEILKPKLRKISKDKKETGKEPETNVETQAENKVEHNL